jgi:uncharacterized membrane protein
MEVLFRILLIIHIASGSIALLSGTWVLVRAKGDQNHRRNGKRFHLAMLINGFSALIMSVIHPNYLLFVIGIFSLYLAESGRRMIAQGKLSGTLMTKIISGIMMLTALIFVGDGMYKWVSGNNFGIVLIVFGTIALFLVRQDIRIFSLSNPEYRQRVNAHIGKMTGSFISASTAFLVVNNTILPGVIAWLLPTFLLVPMIIYWTRKYP